jgi:arabinan endo-1,5-alpha-L-arabinosidase
MPQAACDIGQQSWPGTAALKSDGIDETLPGMNPKPRHPLSPGLFLTAMFVGTMTFSVSALAQSAPVEPETQKPMTVLPLEQSASRGITTRDPSSVVRCKDEYWVFYTGRGVPSYHSKDLVNWERGPAVFKTAPDWIAKTVPENRHMSYWAPDIIKLGDQYLLYYAISSMGKMTSAIGLATNPTLDPNDPAYHWTDQGVVVRTQEGDGYNAIDPCIFHDTDGSLWMTFGSYWTGIKLIQMDPQTGKRIAPDSKLSSLAYNDSIEASYLCKHNDYYYLFVNWGSCCQGTNSSYNIRVGRSKTITGPYLDKVGSDMLKAGGSEFLPTVNGPLFGPGHAGTLNAEGKNWFTSDFEGDIRLNGKATLAIMPLQWNADGWPEAIVNDVKSTSLGKATTK